MQVIRGTYSGRQTAIGYLSLCSVKRKRERATRIAEQRERLFSAIEVAKSEISVMRHRAEESVGEEHGEIFGVYLKILGSESLHKALCRELECGQSAEAAAARVAENGGFVLEGEFDACHVRETLGLLADVFDEIDEQLLPPVRAESATKKGGYIFVSDGEEGGLLARLSDISREDPEHRHTVGTVCVSAEELAASVAMGLPSVLIDPEDLPDENWEGATAIIDCRRKRLILDPDLAELERYSERGREQDERNERLCSMAEKKSITASGQRIYLGGEMSPSGVGELPNFVTAIEEAGGDRSFLAVTDRLLPADASAESQEVQLQIYRDFAKSGADVTVRLFDRPCSPYYGSRRSDKLIGLSGMGLFPLLKSVYRTQLEAILRSMAHGRMSILLPSVSCRSQLTAFRTVLRELKGKLKSEGDTELTDIRIGIELSSPVALLNSAELIPEADFVVIDIDRLAALTSAVEVGDPISEELLLEGIPSALELCREPVTLLREKGLRTSVRGSLAADPMLTDRLLSAGFDRFYLPPHSICAVKERIISFGKD